MPTKKTKKSIEINPIDTINKLIQELINKEQEYVKKTNVAPSLHARIIRQLPQNVLTRNESFYLYQNFLFS